jgi:hypothetical protein
MDGPPPGDASEQPTGRADAASAPDAAGHGGDVPPPPRHGRHTGGGRPVVDPGTGLVVHEPGRHDRPPASTPVAPGARGSPDRLSGGKRLDTLAAMADGPRQTRTVLTLNRGAKLCLLVAVLLLLLAAYLFIVPIEIQSREGPMFDCGSAARPPAAAFPKAVCGRLSRQGQIRAGFAAGGAVVTALGGLLVFGVARRTEYVERASARGREVVDEDEPDGVDAMR